MERQYFDRNVLAKEIEQKYCQPLDTPHATTEESAANHPPPHSNTPPPSSPPIAERPLSPVCLAASDYSLPSPSPHMHTSDSTKVSCPPIPHVTSSPSQQAPSQPSTDPPLPMSPQYSLPTSPHAMSVDSANSNTLVSFSEQSQAQPQPLLSRRRKRRNSPTFLIPPSPSPSPQPPPQPPQLSTTQPQELPGWQPTVVRETKQKKIRRIREEASELDTHFVAVLGQAEFCFSVRESTCETFLPKFRITLKN